VKAKSAFQPRKILSGPHVKEGIFFRRLKEVSVSVTKKKPYTMRGGEIGSVFRRYNFCSIGNSSVFVGKKRKICQGQAKNDITQ